MHGTHLNIFFPIYHLFWRWCRLKGLFSHIYGGRKYISQPSATHVNLPPVLYLVEMSRIQNIGGGGRYIWAKNERFLKFS